MLVPTAKSPSKRDCTVPTPTRRRAGAQVLVRLQQARAPAPSCVSRVLGGPACLLWRLQGSVFTLLINYLSTFCIKHEVLLTLQFVFNDDHCDLKDD